MAKEEVSMTASQISDKWNRNMKNSVTDIVNGVNAVKTNPAQKAAEKADKWFNNIQKAHQEGRFQAGLSKVTLQDWKNKTISKTQSRLAAGVDGAMDKRRAFDQYLVPVVNAGKQKVRDMPDMTLQDSANRMVAFMEHMASNPYKK